MNGVGVILNHVPFPKGQRGASWLLAAGLSKHGTMVSERKTQTKK